MYNYSMNYIIDAKKYQELSKDIYSLINAELDTATDKDIEILYPKLVIMYEFFRLIRGEAFTELREPASEFQKELYQMEESIFSKLKEVKSKVPENSSKAKFYFDNLVSEGLKI